MVALVRSGLSQRAVARRCGVSLSTLQLWLGRAGERPLDEVDWHDRPHVAHRIRRTPQETEALILTVRRELRDESVLGEFGAAAIRQTLLTRPDLPGPPPSIRTIGRVLDRGGALDGRRRVRRASPPPGWHLPDLAARGVELDSFDVIEGLRFQGGATLDVLTAISLHGSLPGAWPMMPGVRATTAVTAMREHWLAAGLPGYAQFDNDARFDGGHGHPNSIGPVIRFCLAVGVVPVFVPPREMGFQASVEAFNGRWQRAVWARTWNPGLEGLRLRTEAYLRAWRVQRAVRIEAAPGRRSFPAEVPNLGRPPVGRLVFLRRTNPAGSVEILKRRYPVSPLWLHRLVRAELDLDARNVRFFALRRREPADQPLLSEVPFEPPERWYR